MAYNPPMNDATNSGPADLAIIGGGAAGVMTALQALRQSRRPLRVLLFEAASTLAEGIAYATPSPVHLLNVPAGRMSALPDVPGDFADHLQRIGAYPDDDRATLEARFASRLHYAPYLRQRLAEAAQAHAGTFEVVQQPVLSLHRGASGGLQLSTAGGVQYAARQAVIACGNNVRPLPLRGAALLPAERLAEAWDYDGVRLLAGAHAIGIIGSGLSMVDSVLSLFDAGHRGAIHVFSRHGLMPLPHAHGEPAVFDPQPLLALSLRQRVRFLRERVREAAARGIPWQSVMERIRPLGQSLWLSLDAADQRRFLRHVVRQWDVHRHRIDARVHARLVEALREGRLQLQRARLQGVSEQDGMLLLKAATPSGERSWALGALVNATGVETRAAHLRNPLLRQLLDDGLARPGPHGLGLDSGVDDACLRDGNGRAQADLRVLGSLRIGTLWESLAVPELRQQARDAAGQALHELDAAIP